MWATWKCFVALVAYLVCCVVVGIAITKLLPRECMTSKCVTKGRLIRYDMSPSVAPCENFYKFVCGNYKSYFNESFNNDDSIGDVLKENELKQLSAFLERPQKKHEDRILRVVKLVYSSCLNVKTIDSEGVQPLLNSIQISGGLPLIEGNKWAWTKVTGTSATSWSIHKMEHKILMAGFEGGSIFSAKVARFPKNGGKFYIHVSPAKNFEYRDSDRDSYRTYINTITKLLHANNTGNLSKEVDDVLDLYTDISKLLTKEENCSSERGEIVNIKQFSDEFPHLSLEPFLRLMCPYVDFPTDMIVADGSREYFGKLKELIEKYTAKSVTNLMMIENIKEVTPMLPIEFRKAYEKLQNETDPQFRPEKNRNILCVKCLQQKLTSALSALYLKEVLHKYHRPHHLSPIIALLKSELENAVFDINWMDDETKNKAYDKIHNMDFYSPVHEEVFMELTNKTKFRIYYEDLCFTGNTSDILTSYLTLQRFTTDKNWELLERGEEIHDTTVDMFSSEIAYDYQRNAVVIPIGYLKVPAYSLRWPNYLNYGGFGSKVATELAKGISMSGSGITYNRTADNWWSIETKAHYRQIPVCFMNQHNTYLRKHINTNLMDPSCAENAAVSLIGVKVAYEAYQKYCQQRFFAERHLTGLQQYSHDQMFFIDYATFYCAKNNTLSVHHESTEKELSDETYEYKVNNRLQNLYYFSEVFQCTRNDTMDPAGKCEMWPRRP